MDQVKLGRTGLDVSVVGLGCGGHSRLGQTAGASEEHSVGLVRKALDLGVTFVDTARAYRTEEIVGRAIEGRRHEVVLSTKAAPQGRGGPLSHRELAESLDKSLGRLRTDHVDVFHLHGVTSDLYRHCLGELVPAMLELRDQGKLRFLAISEAFGRDPGHLMLQEAVKDPCWDVMMVGFHLLNQTARERVFEATRSADIGVLVMFAVRRLLSQPEELRRTVAELVREGAVKSEDVDLDDPLGFLVRTGGASSVVEAAYRFARHEPGTHVVLTGTGNPAHLEENVRSITGGPLPQADLERLGSVFGHLDTLSGN